jgi:hypothetical protein
MEYVQKFFAFIAGFFREDRPESFARGITAVIVAFVLGWDTMYLRLTHTLPDVSVMGIQIAFMTAFYFGGKSIGAYTTIKTSGAPVPEEKTSGNGNQ